MNAGVTDIKKRSHALMFSHHFEHLVLVLHAQHCGLWKKGKPTIQIEQLLWFSLVDGLI